MWRTNRTFFGGLNLENSSENVERKSHFFCGLNLEQLLAYRKCGEKIALFLAVWTWNSCWERGRDCCLQPIDGNEGFAGFFFLHFFTSFSLFSTLFPYFFLFFHFFLLCIFSHLFHFFHIISLFSPFFPFFFHILFALSLTWPRPQPCRLTLPSLTLPHITSPLLSFLNTN